MINNFNIQDYKGFKFFVDYNIRSNTYNCIAARKKHDGAKDIITFILDDYYILEDSYIVIKRFHEEVDKFLKNQISASDFK